MLQDAWEISVGYVEQLQEVMFDFDIVVGPRKAEPRRCFQNIAGGFIQFSDQTL
jgi:hypothetical protein